MHWLKKVGIGVAGVTGVAVIGATGFLMTFNPNDYKSQIIDWVKTNKQRTLAINGEIKLTVYPQIGFKVSDVSLSEHASAVQFAKLGELQLGVQLMPLLSKKVIVDSLDVDGLQVRVTRDAKGVFNFADLLEKSTDDTSSSQKLEMKVALVSLKNSQAAWQDEMMDRAALVSKLNVTATDIDPSKGATLKADGLVSTGPISNPKAQVDGKFAVSTAVAMDSSTGLIEAKQLVASFDGAAAGQKGLKVATEGNVSLLNGNTSIKPLKLTFDQSNAGQQVKATVNAAAFALTGRAIDLQQLALDANLSQGGNSVVANAKLPTLVFKDGKLNASDIALNANLSGNGNKATIKGQLAAIGLAGQQLNIGKMALNLQGNFADKQVQTQINGPIAVGLDALHVQLPQLQTSGRIQLKGMPASSWQLAGSIDAAIKAQTVSTKLNGKLDASNLNLQAEVKQFARPTFKANLSLDALDVDRYVTKSAASAKAGAASTASADNQVLIPDLPVFHNLTGTADVKIGRLQRAPWVVNDVSVHFEAVPGLWKVAPFSAKVFQGQVKAGVSANWGTTPSFTVSPEVSGLALGELLKTLSGDDKISGKANASGQVSFSGKTLAGIKQSLNGNLKVKVADGAIKGISMIDTVQKAQSSINSLREKAKTGASATAKTEFSDLSASFQLNNGVAKNSDLSMIAPLLKASGSGQFNIPASTIDYNALGGVEYKKDAGALGGVNVPVHIGGTFTQPTFTVDYASVAKQILQNKLNVDTKAIEDKAKADLAAQQEKLKQSADAQKAKLNDQVKGEQDKLKDKLKGLLGK